jgi:hypothetical protein
MTDMLQPTISGSSTVPYSARINGEYPMKLVYSVYEYVKIFIAHNLTWLKETGGAKNLLIKFPDAIVSISRRIGPATHIPGKILNTAADILIPLQALGGCASTLLGFAEVGSKFPAMFISSPKQVQYVVRGTAGKEYRAQFPLKSWEQNANKAVSIADWTLSFTGCAGYIWRMNHTPDQKFPLAPVATWSARYMSIQGLYSEGRFLYKTLSMGEHREYHATQEKYLPLKKKVTVAWEEVAGSLLKLSLSVVCLSLDIFKALAAKGNQSPWIDTAIFCAGIAPTFITPVAMRYWPKIVTEPLYAAASA